MSLHILAQGTLHKDPQLRQSASGKTFTTANVRIEADGSTTWCSLIVFDQTAQDELLRCHAGDAVSVQGKLKVSVFEKAGEHRASLDIVANSVTALRPKPRPKQQRQSKVDGRAFDARQAYGRPGPAHEAEPDFDDPIPFD
ncbi:MULTISPECIES: single-stranded DNA-binding protein [unclassified Methylococcus]|uniref:single-stranded DNA-binding protein n=1 Tax=unclassified Methylococcus TaxID=2618889 RepID=UPI003D7CA1C4